MSNSIVNVPCVGQEHLIILKVALVSIHLNDGTRDRATKAYNGMREI